MKPHISTSNEFGLELKLFNGRLGLDATYYTTDTKNQVIPITLPQSSGYTGRLSNAGLIKNSGLELVLNANVVKTKDFSWSTTANFSTNKSEVVELVEGLDRYELVGFGDNGEKIIAKVGGPVLGIYGFKQRTVDDTNSPFFGENVYGPNGAPLRRDNLEYLGKANPDFILGLNNSFNYKGFNLSFLLDYHQGGIAYSAATNIMYGGGDNQVTADWRNNGVGGEGVILNSDGSYSANNIVLSGDDIRGIWASPWRKISPNNFFDATYVKLREMNFGYTFTKKDLEKLPFERANISFVGRNLLIWDKMPNQDPDVYFEGIPGYTGGWTYPTSRTYGVSLRVSF